MTSNDILCGFIFSTNKWDTSLQFETEYGTHQKFSWLFRRWKHPFANFILQSIFLNIAIQCSDCPMTTFICQLLILLHWRRSQLLIFLYPLQTKFGRVYRNHPVRPSVRPSMYLVSTTPKRLIGFLWNFTQL